MNKNKGFTLVEVVVVLIILGVLAKIALTGYFSWITKSVASEALTSLKTYKERIVLCIQTHVGNESSCNSLTFPNSTNFWYGFVASPIVNNSPAFYFTAGPATSRYGLHPWEDYIRIIGDSSGKITCSAEGQLKGIC